MARTPLSGTPTTSGTDREAEIETLVAAHTTRVVVLRVQAVGTAESRAGRADALVGVSMVVGPVGGRTTAVHTSV